MRYLFDTNAWLRWFHQPEELNALTRRIINAESVIALSPMSIIEIAQKVHKRKLSFSIAVEQWVRDSTPVDRIELLPITIEIALRSYEWPDDFQGDPADRIIAATAAVHGLILVTSDEKLLGRTDMQTLSTR